MIKVQIQYSYTVWKGGSREGKMQQHRSRVEVTKAPSVMTPKVTTSNNFGGHLQKFNIRELSAAIGIWGKNFLAVEVGLHSDSGPIPNSEKAFEATTCICQHFGGKCSLEENYRFGH